MILLDDSIFKPEFERAIEILKTKFRAEIPNRTIDGMKILTFSGNLEEKQIISCI